MKIIEPSYEIWDCPDGEAALAKIERVGRECYKSEDKIDDGMGVCPHCNGAGGVLAYADEAIPRECPKCKGAKRVRVREPSSHAFVRNILRTNRREELAKKAAAYLWGRRFDADAVEAGRYIVDMTLDNYRDDPPHDGLLEHCSVTVHFTADRGFTHELVRHRHGSYAQECVAGGTKVTKKYTIKELYARSSTPQGKTHNRTIRLRSCREDGTIIRNRIVSVMHKGVQPTMRVTTRLGYVIEATNQHEFMLPDGGFTRLAALNVGDAVMVNGRPSLLNITDEELKHYYLNVRLAPQEIADNFGAPYASVLRALKELGIFEKRRNDKNPEKYNKNHTAESYEKMRKTVLKQYEDGRTPWNKDVREGEHPSVDKQAASLREHHHDNSSEEDNSNWKGGVSTGYYMKKCPPGPCELCATPNASEVHHVDHNRKNNARSNLMRICINCHDKLHHGWHVGTVAHPDEIVSIKYVGVQDVYDIEMEKPYPNYVADGFVVHNSTRYCNYSKGKFGESITVIKQSFELEEQIETWMHALGEIEKDYMKLIASGVKPEIARDVLSQATKASITLTVNFNSLRNFFRKRCSPRAHPRMRALMIPFRDEMRQRIPIIFEELI